VKIHCNCYIAQFTTLEDDVFLAPGVTVANDLHPGSSDFRDCMKGPTIKRGAQIGCNVTLLPGVTIGEHALIGAGSVVSRDIPARTVAYGNPARPAKKISELKCPVKKNFPYKDLG
jgi:acetyltransferase-like isoleucine patch superfamily enzyme